MKTPPRSAVAFLMSCAVAGTAYAAASTAYYEADDPNPAPLKYPDDTLHATLMQQLNRVRVTTVKDLATGATDVAKFSHTQKVAVLYVAGARPGAEMDIMVEEKGQYTPVETFWDGDTISFKTGQPRADIYGKASSKEEIQKKYGVGAFVESGSAWDNNSLFIVETALATLTKEELAGVAGLPFHRMPKDPSSKSVRGVAVAMYVPEKQQIELYDFGIEADTRRFFGTVDKVTPGSVASVIHECGHALSRKLARGQRGQAETTKAAYEDVNARLMAGKKAYDEEKATYTRTKDAALVKSLNEKAAGLKVLMAERTAKEKEFQAVAAQMVAGESKGSAIERAFDAKLSYRKSPTVYGRTSLAESFADSLALYKLDRAALERAAPGVPAWFESAAYTSLLAAPPQ